MITGRTTDDGPTTATIAYLADGGPAIMEEETPAGDYFQ